MPADTTETDPVGALAVEEAPAPAPVAAAGVAEAGGIFLGHGPVGAVDGMDLRQVVNRQRLRFAVPVRQPLVLISQIQRSGGTLLSQLLDGHGQLHVHPSELHIGRPNKYRWPRFDPDARPDELFEQIREPGAINAARDGYQKLGKAELAAGAEREDLLLPFIFAGQLQARLFARALAPAPRTRRQVLDAYATSYFNAWLDYAGLYRSPDTVRYWVAFVARLLARPDQVEQMFADYPDGRLMIPVREPESWLASARRHSNEYADTKTALDLWVGAHKRSLQLAGDHPAMVRLVRFEALVGDTEATMRGVARFLDIDFTPSLTQPTFNGIPVPSNSSFAAGVGVDAASATRGQHLDKADRAAVSARTEALHRKLAAIADYQHRRDS